MVTFQVPDMSCGRCASAIAKALAATDKTARIEVNVPEKLVSVTSTASELKLLEAVREAGYTPRKLGAPRSSAAAVGGCCCTPPASAVDVRQAERATRGSCCG